MMNEGPTTAAGRVSCGTPAEPFFCAATEGVPGYFDHVSAATEYPKGGVIFIEGQAPRGVYVLCRGHVKLYTSSGDARVLITDIAEPGDVLGLSAVISGEPYEVSAGALDACRLTFIGREDFLKVLDGHASAAMHAARLLSRNYRTTHRQAGLLGLSNSAAGKLASVLLERRGLRGARADLFLKHEEIGQLIGASRETVTRLLNDFKRRRLIKVNGTALLVLDPSGLEALTAPR